MTNKKSPITNGDLYPCINFYSLFFITLLLLISGNAFPQSFQSNIRLPLSSSVQTGFPVYNIEANTDGSRMYCYNTLASEGNGLFIVEGARRVNLNDIQPTSQDGVLKAIGDVVFNPYNNTFFVSENGDFGSSSSACVKIYGDTENDKDQLLSTIQLPTGVQYAKEMQITPEQKLYVMANMHNGFSPKILVYNSESPYDLLDTYTFTLNIEDDFDYYSGHFCYNSIDHTMYATIHPTEITLDPYHSVANTMFEFGDPYGNENKITEEKGVFVKLDDNSIPNQKNFPSKIICPDNEMFEQSQYHNYMIIAGAKLLLYNYNTGQFIDDADFAFNDITYSKYGDMVYGIIDTPNTTCNDDRKCIIKSIKIINGQFVVENISAVQEESQISGQCSGIFNNPYDGKIYIYNKIGSTKKGDQPIRLYYFEPGSGLEKNTTSLQLTTLYPELDHCPDYHYYFYNLITPYFNPANNTMYFPNGGHSCISMVTYTPNEPLLLNTPISDPQSPTERWSWLSFPRLQRTGNNTVPVNEVLEERIVPEGYIEGSKLANVPITATQSFYNTYSGTQWQTAVELNSIQSTYGYKINLKYDPEPENRWILLDGNVLDKDYEISELTGGIENWIGYWSYENQDIFDALGDYADDIKEIKHQDYYCNKTMWYDDSNPQQVSSWWNCSQETHNIKYGDMVILKPYNNIYNFKWNYAGNPTVDIVDESPKYYDYTETDDYKAFIIELDSTDNIVEMAAMIDDSCVGACTVYSEDTVKIIRGYIGDYPGDSITFEMYYGTKSTSGTTLGKIKDYYVKNNLTGKYENRVIHAGENQGAYYVSFKEKNAEETDNIVSDYKIMVFPNPATTKVNIMYTLLTEANVSISAYDLLGRKITDISNKSQSKGTYNEQWDFSNGYHSVKNGIYLIKISINDNVITKKVMVDLKE